MSQDIFTSSVPETAPPATGDNSTPDVFNAAPDVFASRVDSPLFPETQQHQAMAESVRMLEDELLASQAAFDEATAAHQAQQEAAARQREASELAPTDCRRTCNPDTLHNDKRPYELTSRISAVPMKL